MEEAELVLLAAVGLLVALTLSYWFLTKVLCLLFGHDWIPTESHYTFCGTCGKRKDYGECSQ